MSKKKSKKKPKKKTDRVVYTHDWDVLGDTRTRKWGPDKKDWDEKRRVKVSINTWRGISPGAIHYDMRIEVEQNLWWSPVEDCWVSLSCDYSNDEVSAEAKCLSMDQARELARSALKILGLEDERYYRITWENSYEDEDEEVSIDDI